MRACEPVSFLAGKRGSRRYSSTGFSKNVAGAEATYQLLEVVSFCDRERAEPSLIKITGVIFLVKMYTGAF